MNVGIVRKPGNQSDWSEDSEPDSPASSTDRDNSFTSDTDPDSSTGSDSESTEDEASASLSSESSVSAGKLRLPGQSSNPKRPLIEEIHSKEEPPMKKEK